MTTQSVTQSATFEPQADAIKFTMLLAGIVFALMMASGLIMRTAQGDLITFDPVLFYQILTAHGAGMVGTPGLTGAAILWYFLGRYVPLTPGRFSFRCRRSPVGPGKPVPPPLPSSVTPL